MEETWALLFFFRFIQKTYPSIIAKYAWAFMRGTLKIYIFVPLFLFLKTHKKCIKTCPSIIAKYAWAFMRGTPILNKFVLLFLFIF